MTETLSPSTQAGIGIWRGNPALVQLLGLCPLLAITTTATQGLGLGLATLFVLTASNALVSLVRPITPHHARLPVFVLIIASLVSVVELTLAAWFAEIHRALGIFIPLIVTNCTLLARAESFAYRNGPLASARDGFYHGIGFLIALVALGSVRELLGHGSLFRDLDQLFGAGLADFGSGLVVSDAPLLLALLPPGAFFALAALVVLHRRLTRHPDREPR